MSAGWVPEQSIDKRKNGSIVREERQSLKYSSTPHPVVPCAGSCLNTSGPAYPARNRSEQKKDFQSEHKSRCPGLAHPPAEQATGPPQLRGNGKEKQQCRQGSNRVAILCSSMWASPVTEACTELHWLSAGQERPHLGWLDRGRVTVGGEAPLPSGRMGTLRPPPRPSASPERRPGGTPSRASGSAALCSRARWHAGEPPPSCGCEPLRRFVGTSTQVWAVPGTSSPRLTLPCYPRPPPPSSTPSTHSLALSLPLFPFYVALCFCSTACTHAATCAALPTALPPHAASTPQADALPNAVSHVSSFHTQKKRRRPPRCSRVRVCEREEQQRSYNRQPPVFHYTLPAFSPTTGIRLSAFFGFQHSAPPRSLHRHRGCVCRFGELLHLFIHLRYTTSTARYTHQRQRARWFDSSHTHLRDSNTPCASFLLYSTSRTCLLSTDGGCARLRWRCCCLWCCVRRRLWCWSTLSPTPPSASRPRSRRTR